MNLLPHKAIEHYRAVFALLPSYRKRWHSGLAHGRRRPGSRLPIVAPKAFARDLPGARIELLPGGHFLLESHLDAVATRIHGFLAMAIGR